MLIKATPVDNSLGLVYIAEQTTPDSVSVKNIEQHQLGNVFFVSFDSVLHSFDVMNRNRRQYKRANIEECLKAEKIQDLIHGKGWFGEMDHPYQRYKNQPLTPERIQKVELDRRSHKILEPRFHNNLLEARIETASGTDVGRGFACEIIQGMEPRFSCRAIAQLQMIDNRPTVVVRRVITYDWVSYPSHKEAHAISKPVGNVKSIETNTTFTEGASDVLIPIKELLSIVTHNDYNTQFVMESFELTEDDFRGFNEDHSQILLADGTNTVGVQMSMKSKEIADKFFASL